MKKFVATVALAFLGLGGWLVSRSRAERRTPTAAQLQKALPGESRAIFENSKTLQLYSLNPSWNLVKQKKTTLFHGYQVLGAARLTPEEASQARRYFYDGLSGEDRRAACFSPRHGLRATHNGRSLDLVICFHCAQSHLYIGGKRAGGAHIDPGTQPAFDALLRSHGLPASP